MNRVRQKDIAAQLGLDRSTVSKALKGDPAIAAGTRTRVLQTAAQLGFRRDPLLTALSHYRKRNSTPYRSTIAWIHNYPQGTDMSVFPGYADYFAGATMRCNELGYRLEPFWIDGRKLTIATLPRILKARGIRAIIFAPQASVGVKLDFPVEEFCVLTIGYSLAAPKMDVITNDHFTTMTEILERIHSDGFERIGCYLWETDNERMGRRARSALLAYSKENTCTVETYQHFDPEAFAAWIQSNRLDAVVCRDRKQAEVVGMLNRQRAQPIRCIGYAVEGSGNSLPGMSHNNHLIGTRAAEWISSKLERGQFGQADAPQRLLVAGKWVEGKSSGPESRLHIPQGKVAPGAHGMVAVDFLVHGEAVLPAQQVLPEPTHQAGK